MTEKFRHGLSEPNRAGEGRQTRQPDSAGNALARYTQLKSIDEPLAQLRSGTRKLTRRNREPDAGFGGFDTITAISQDGSQQSSCNARNDNFNCVF